jgi:hypothetical protein
LAGRWTVSCGQAIYSYSSACSFGSLRTKYLRNCNVRTNPIVKVMVIKIVLIVFGGTFETRLDQGCQHNTAIQNSSHRSNDAWKRWKYLIHKRWAVGLFLVTFRLQCFFQLGFKKKNIVSPIVGLVNSLSGQTYHLICPAETLKTNYIPAKLAVRI